MLPHETRRKADVVFSSFVIGLGFYLIYTASQMPWRSSVTGGAAQWFLSPGLFPATLGIMLILFSASVLVTAIREEGHRGIIPMFLNWVRNLPTNRPFQRLLLMIGLIGVYIFVGLGSADYRLVSGIFLFIFIALFWWPGAGAELAKRVVVTLGTATLVPVIVAYLFSTYLYVPMP